MSPGEFRVAVAAYPAPDGVTLHAHVVPLRDEDGRPVYWRAMIQAECSEHPTFFAPGIASTEPIELLPVGVVPIMCRRVLAILDRAAVG